MSSTLEKETEGEGDQRGGGGLGRRREELCQLGKHTGGNVVSRAPAAGWSHVQDLWHPGEGDPYTLHLSNLAPVLPAGAQNHVWVLELSFHNQALWGSGDVLILFDQLCEDIRNHLMSIRIVMEHLGFSLHSKMILFLNTCREKKNRHWQAPNVLNMEFQHPHATPHPTEWR